MRFLLTAALLIACSSDKDDDQDPTGTDTTDTDTDTTDTDTDEPDLCEATIASVSPAPNAADVATDTVVIVGFSEPVGATDWSLEIVGVAGDAALATDGLSAMFVPAAPLASETDYTISASACDDTQQASFRTAIGPLDPADIEGRTYAVTFNDLTILQPANGAAVQTLLPVDLIVVQVGDINPVDGSLEAFGAVAFENNQGDLELDCEAALSGIELDFSGNPFFRMGPTTLNIPAGDLNVPILDFTLLGRFDANGDAISDVRVSGSVDLTDMQAPLTCGLVSLLAGSPCEPCFAGATQNHCLAFEATATRADEDTRFDVEAECAL